jgi:hypothetical protein
MLRFLIGLPFLSAIEKDSITGMSVCISCGLKESVTEGFSSGTEDTLKW